jgi:hypothetical protein
VGHTGARGADFGVRALDTSVAEILAFIAPDRFFDVFVGGSKVVTDMNSLG